jgi:peptide/nickel transport system substrate-binding protein
MRLIWLPWFALLSLALPAAALAETRPHYGGTLRVEVREAIETPDPPQTGPRLAQLNSGFSVTRWEAGRRAVYASNENAPGGRPFLDTVDVQLGRSLREQALDLELGKADVVEVAPSEVRRITAPRRLWSSAPVRLLALIFGARVDDPHVREALALAVDRAAILNVLLQRQGEISGALLPQWLSGYAFLFSSAADITRARVLVAGLPASARSLSLGVDDPVWQPIAARIALNARDAGLNVSVAGTTALADVRLVETRIASDDPGRALAGVATSLGLPEPPPADSPEAEYRAERSLLDGFHVVPLFHLPYLYGVSARVKGGPGISPLGEWRFEPLWLEGAQP